MCDSSGRISGCGCFWELMKVSYDNVKYLLLEIIVSEGVYDLVCTNLSKPRSQRQNGILEGNGNFSATVYMTFIP